MTEDVLRYYVDVLGVSPEDIHLVDSSNNGVRDDLVPLRNQVVFDQDKVCPPAQLVPTDHEMCSLRQVQKSHLQLDNYDWVFKITGKYKLPHIHSNVPVQHTLAVQNWQDHPDSNWQNTELFATKGSNFNRLIDQLSSHSNKTMEMRMHAIASEESACKLNPQRNLAPYKRRCGNHMEYL